MTTGRAGFVMRFLANGQVLAAGGDGFLTSAELYNPLTGTWTATGSMNVGTDTNVAVLLQNGEVFVLNDNLYNPSTGTWTATARDPIAGGARAVLLPNGDVFAGGTIQGDSVYQTSGRTLPRRRAQRATKIAGVRVRCSILGRSWSRAASPKCRGNPILRRRRTDWPHSLSHLP